MREKSRCTAGSRRGLERAPGALAVLGAEETLTYGELVGRARRVAAWLRAQGLGPEVRVPVVLERSPESVVAALAVLLAGGAYVPLDPAYPQERLAWQMADAWGDGPVRVLLTRSGLAPEIVQAGGARVLYLDAALPDLATGASSPATPEQAAYVIYTSGSTGRPKGVVVSHGALANLVDWHVRTYGLAPGDRSSLVAGPGFDAAVWEVWPVLSAGASLAIPTDEVRSSPTLLAAWLAAEGITVTFLPTPLAEAVLAEPWPEGAALRALLTGGDRLRRGPRQGLPFVLHNHYGPTEGTVVATCGLVAPERPAPPIGLPMANARVYLVDRDFALAPASVPGELLLGGDGLARGYLGRPDLTAERFVPDPFSGLPGARLYRTGDLVRWTAAGELEFLGRIDHQVKVRGVRLELGEIEAVLLSLAGVREAVVVVRSDGSVRSSGDLWLVAYVVGDTAVEELRRSLRERLPEPMVPAFFVLLPALPLTPNGKVDRRALPAPAFAPEAAGVAPRTPAEALLAGIWEEVLGVEKAGAEDDFFAAGGHSLLAARAASRASAAFGIEVPVSLLFDAPTPAALAAEIEARLAASPLAMAPPLGPAPAAARERGLPLSFAQERLWFLDQLAPGEATYNIAGGVRLAGDLDVSALSRALAEVVRRHEALRSRFAPGPEGPVQWTLPAPAPHLPVVDLAGLAGEVERLAVAEARRPFDLAGGPLLRTVLLRLGAAEHVLLAAMHHIAADGWSMEVFLREVAALYGAFVAGQPSPLPEPPLQYGDFALWERSWLQGESLEARLAAARERLAGVPRTLELPTDHPRPALLSSRGARLPISLSAGLSAAVTALGRREGATTFMVLLAAFEALLGRYTGAEDLLVGSPVANRGRVELEGLIGCFVNTLVLRGDLSGDPPVRELLARTRAATLAAYPHQDLPFERLVEDLVAERSLSRNPLIQVLFVFQGRPAAPALQGLAASRLDVHPGTAKLELTLELEERPGGFGGWLEYSSDLFAPGTIERLAGHYETLLAGLLADPGRLLSELPLLTAEERAEILGGWSGRETEWPEGDLLHELFAAQARRTPGAVALIHGETRWTYGELAGRAARLARRLRRLGAGPEVPVGIFLSRTPDLVAAMLAVLGSGGAYVPLDPVYPQERLTAILADCAAPVLVTERSLTGLVSGYGAQVVLVDGEDGKDSRDDKDDRGSEGAGAEALAYVIYTSGSTGRPKGVAIEHRSAAALVHWARETFAPAELAGVLAATSICFDLSVFEIFVPLATGGCVILAENALELPRLQAATAGEVTLVNTVPSAMAELVRQGAVPASVRTVNLAGEPLRGTLARSLHGLGTVRRLLNLYGPSEDTTYSTISEVGIAGEPTIGRPLPNTRAYVVDAHLHPLPVGVPGELLLAGRGLARGYLGRPELTAERFVPDPFAAAPGARLYRTGDLARWTPEGELEFLGRLDHQVKVRGFRIELGEIETALQSHPAVRETVVVARESGAPGAEARDLRLVAYVATSEPLPGFPAELRAHLQARLPEYMVPAAWVALEALPRTPNGKVDRKALQAPAAAAETRWTAPRTPEEELLAGLWAEVLGVERVGTDDDFFGLGGHSLLATRVISRVRKTFGVEIPLRRLFESPTVAGFAAALARARGASEAPAPPLKPGLRQGAQPLSFAQERLWFLDRLEGGGPLYNLPAAAHLSGALDPAALEAAFREIVRRHETLRTRFADSRGRPEQWIAPAVELPISWLDLRSLPGTSGTPRCGRSRPARPGGPSTSRPGRSCAWSLARLSDEEHLLLLDMHHIVSDAWSMGVLVQELAALYAAALSGRPSPLPALPVQYADFARWQREWLAGGALETQLAYWRERLSGIPAELALPLDRPRPAVRTGRGGIAPAPLSPELTAELRRLGRRSGATLFMTLLAAFQALLARYGAAADVPVGSPIAGRNRVETEGLIGFFVNTLVLRTDLSGDPSFAGLLSRVRETTLGAYEHQDVPFEKLVEELAPRREVGRTPFFQVMLTLQNAPLAPLELPGLRLEMAEVESGTAKFDLSLTLMERQEEIAGWLEHDLDLFDPSTAGRIAGHLRVLLAAAAAGPDRPLSEQPLLSGEEVRQLAAWGRGKTAETGGTQLVHELFEAQVDRAPAAPAVLAGARELSYGELDERANRLARHLRRLGVGPEVPVALALPRSLEGIVALLAILKAGGAYVPLDPAYPLERRAWMLADSGARVLVTRADLRYDLPAVPGMAVVSLDEDWPAIARESGGRLAGGGFPESLAYVIYTSGSTGRPKPVGVGHGTTAGHLSTAIAAYSLSTKDRLLQTTAWSFDMSVEQILMTLAAGAVLILTGDLDPGGLLREVAEREATVVDLPPSLLLHWLRETGRTGAPDLPPLRLVIAGGEALPLEVPRLWPSSAMKRSRLLNGYGPTEAVVTATFHDFSAHPLAPAALSAPIGRPLPGRSAYVLDPKGNPVPAGVPGELLLGGVLARGYLGRPEATAERFVPDPFSGSPGERLYRTGDRVRWLASGDLDFLGRIDQQVKVRGFRIEPGEIEAALTAHPAVAEAAVVVQGEEDRRLVAFLVPEGGGPVPGTAELRAFLGRTLPEHMVPGAFVELAALPLTPNGKVDRRALDGMAPRPEPMSFVAPRTGVEKVLSGIWAEVLRQPRVGASDDFFELGGHSLLATQVQSRVREALGVELGLRKFFAAPTLEAMAVEIEALREQQGLAPLPVPAVIEDRLPEPPPAERHRLIQEWGRGPQEAAGGPCFHERVSARAAAAPDALAVACDNEELSFGRLDRLANGLALRLRRLGVGPEVPVAVLLDRSVEAVVAILGVLKAGGAYVPVDPSYPAERVAWLLADSQASVAVTSAVLAASLPPGVSAVLAEEVEASAARPRAGVEPDHPAYVIYTSGSTGWPKGVVVRHGAVVNLAQALRDTVYGGEAGPLRVGVNASFSFDGSVKQIVQLAWGHSLHVLPQEVRLDPAALVAYVRRHRLDALDCTPSQLRLLLAAGLGEEDAAPALVLVGGEAVDAGLRDAALARSRTRFWNVYGPTECTVDTTVAPFAVAVPPSRIGRPLAGVAVYVAGADGSLAPAGLEGELLVGGAGLARGYLGRPELTAERFIPDPWSGAAGSRLYRTGDLVRWLPDATLDFLGRIDSQVKVRGFRVEPGEIEAALALHPGLRECAVVAAGDRLVACWTPAGDESPRASELRDHLKARLPEYMVPAVFARLAELPRTPSGKVDRRALLPLAAAAGEESGEVAAAPRDPAEELIAGIWCEVLGRERVGLGDSFFDVGGHSLLATQVVARMREAFGVEVPLRRLFETPTVAALAAALAELRQQGKPVPPPPLTASRHDGAPPLSFAQERLWFLDRLEGASPVYNVPAVLRLSGRLRPDALATACREIVRRHEVLRTRFAEEGGRPVQVIAQSCDLPWVEIDLRSLPAPAAEARAVATAEARRPFALATGPLVRLRLLRLGEEEHVLVLVLHHIVSDAWSMGVLVRELGVLYPAAVSGARSPLPALPVQYADYARWQRELLAGGGLEDQLAWWRQRLAHLPDVLELPTDRPRTAALRRRGGTVRLALPAGLAAALRNLGRRSEATLFMTLLAGFQALLARYTGGDEAPVGSPVAGRTRVETEGLIGFFVNTLVLRTDLAGDPSFTELLGRARETTLGAYDRQEVPFERLVEELAPRRDLRHTPLFQVMLAFQNTPPAPLALPGLWLEPMAIETGTAKFDLMLTMWEEGEGLAAVLEHDCDLFDPVTAQRIAGHLGVLLAGAVAAPARRLGELPLLGAAETHQLAREWSAPPATAPAALGPCLHELVAARAAATPEALAVVCAGEELTYGRLDRLANGLALRLRTSGVGPEVRVALLLDRSAAAVVAILGVLKAGGAYVPVDAAYPPERVSWLLADSGAPVVVTSERLAGRVPQGVRSVLVEETGESAAAPASGSGPEHAAYVIYTSGSTGRPKGVVVRHGAVVNLARALRETVYEGEAGPLRVSLNASISFDASVQQLVQLAWGHCVHVLTSEVRLDPAALVDYVRRHRLDVLDCTPSQLRALLAAGLGGEDAGGAFPSRVLVGGEAIDAELRDAALARPRVRFWNLYGPTECTVDDTAALLAPGMPASRIGRPLAQVAAQVVDRHGELVPLGVPGELHIGGPVLARGYLGRPELTAERFIPDPFGGVAGGRLYRTGDLVRRLADGALDYLGRIDQQVKIRGFRIEPGEIEGALATHPAVAAAAVVARQLAPGDLRLAAYVVLRPGNGLTAFPGAFPGDLRDHLRSHLPEPMVPTLWTELDALPLTPTGKLDRRALPAPALPAGSGLQTDPRSPEEELLAGLFAQILGLGRVGIFDSFFELGGHSLLATQLVSRVRRVFGRELPLRALFESPTVAGLAAVLAATGGEAAATLAPVPRPAAGEAGLPLSFAQERLWFLEQLEPGSAFYSIPMAVLLAGRLSVPVIAAVLREIVGRHESLRTIFGDRDGRPFQAIAPHPEVKLPLVDLAVLPPAERERTLGELATGDARRPFDLARGPLVRFALVRLEPERHALLFNLHHIVSDGWSSQVLLREVAALYEAFAAGRPSPLPPLPIQYADYAVWQRSWLQGEVLAAGLAYWRRQLAGICGARPALSTGRGRRWRPSAARATGIDLDGELTAALHALAHGQGATLFMTLLAAFQALLSRLTGQEDVAVGSPIANRNRAEVEGLIGFFVNTLVLRTDLAGDPTLPASCCCGCARWRSGPTPTRTCRSRSWWRSSSPSGT